VKDVKVSVRKIQDYQSFEMRQALTHILSLLGGIENIIKPGSRVFIKINHLSPPSRPEEAIVTHPALTREVLLLLKEIGCALTVGDDIQSKREDGFLRSGYRTLCNELGIPLLNLKEKGFRRVDFEGRVLERAYISPVVLDSDFIVNLPKLKTHSFTMFTGAIKNMYGIIPPGLRSRFHRQFFKNEVFSQMLVDIFSCAPPHLNIMDAIVAMEGEGPSAGRPKKVNLVLASLDAVALDAVASKIIDLDPLQVLTTRYADERGLGIGQLEKIAIIGERMQDIQIKDFKQSSIALGLIQKRLPAFLHAFFQDQLILLPQIISKRCTACWECVDICPVGAAQKQDDVAKIDASLCIHCMCCHEVCRFHAVKLKQKFFGRAVRGVTKTYKKVLSIFS
jgi:uncharacterized protein (DUF362 family)/Pyruvate/2-oxoacid:ferredoxin oxidoreductase delta subunit